MRTARFCGSRWSSMISLPVWSNVLSGRYDVISCLVLCNFGEGAGLVPGWLGGVWSHEGGMSLPRPLDRQTRVKTLPSLELPWQDPTWRRLEDLQVQWWLKSVEHTVGRVSRMSRERQSSACCRVLLVSKHVDMSMLNEQWTAFIIHFENIFTKSTWFQN